MKRFIVNIVFIALMFGVFVGWPFLYDEGVINGAGIVVILLEATVWGILFFIVYMTVTKLAARNADKFKTDDGYETDGADDEMLNDKV